MWVTFLVKNALRVGGYGAAPREAYGAPLLAAFHASGTFVGGLFAVEQGVVVLPHVKMLPSASREMLP